MKRAYRTADFFEQRVPVMQEWGDFLTETMGPVVREPRPPAKKPAADPVKVRSRSKPKPRRKAGGATVGTTPSDGRRLAKGVPGAQLPLGAGVD